MNTTGNYRAMGVYRAEAAVVGNHVISSPSLHPIVHRFRNQNHRAGLAVIRVFNQLPNGDHKSGSSAKEQSGSGRHSLSCVMRLRQ